MLQDDITSYKHLEHFHRVIKKELRAQLEAPQFSPDLSASYYKTEKHQMLSFTSL